MVNESAEERYQQVATVFLERFGNSPSSWCRAPGRVDLMGSHTDYNLGFVLTLSIGLDTWFAVRARPDRVVRVYSCNQEEEDSFELDRIGRAPRPHWSDYVRGVASVLENEGLQLCGFDGVIHSTVPLSSGLSSSAALECAAATAFEDASGWKLDPIQKAVLCQQAENRFVGVNCGILDQYTSCLGQEGCALLLDCRDLSSRPIRIAEGIQVVICDTKFKRELAESEYGRRRAQCEEGARCLGLKALREITVEEFNAREQVLPAEVSRRCRFIVEENDRVLRLAEALACLDRRDIGRLAEESFRGACALYEIAVPAMHAMMEAMAKAPGVIGARQAGAGFGGCMVAFVEKSAVAEFAAQVRVGYRALTSLEPEIFPVEAAPGAGVIRF